jgi:hypothetical protein
MVDCYQDCGEIEICLIERAEVGAMEVQSVILVLCSLGRTLTVLAEFSNSKRMAW